MFAEPGSDPVTVPARRQIGRSSGQPRIATVAEGVRSVIVTPSFAPVDRDRQRRRRGVTVAVRHRVGELVGQRIARRQPLNRRSYCSGCRRSCPPHPPTASQSCPQPQRRPRRTGPRTRAKTVRSSRVRSTVRRIDVVRRHQRRVRATPSVTTLPVAARGPSSVTESMSNTAVATSSTIPTDSVPFALLPSTSVNTTARSSNSVFWPTPPDASRCRPACSCSSPARSQH